MTQAASTLVYQIRRSARAERVRIVVKAGRVEVVAPLQFPEQRIHQFVKSKESWIVQAIAKIASKTRRPNPFVPVDYQHGAEISYQGRKYPLIVQPTALKRIKIELNTAMIAHIPQTIMAEDYRMALKTALFDWLKKQTLQHALQLVERHGVKNQLWPGRVSVKTQKSRWGSCGVGNNIQLNWLLIMAPPDVLEYVVVHELCHIQERNHSARFWALVEAHLPAYRQSRLWLKQHGALLMAVAE